MYAVRPLGACGAATVALSLFAAPAAFAADVDITYVEKPDTWKCMLIDKDHVGIYDRKHFATWVREAQEAPAAQRPARTFSSIFSFTQCFSGGFLGALRDEGVILFGANSSCRFFESASYDTANDRSYYGWAWGLNFDNLLATDKAITQAAANALAVGEPAIPKNPNFEDERPQYLTDSAPDFVGLIDQPIYAILYAGAPETMDESDLDMMYGELVYHGFTKDNIMVLFGDETLYGGKKATKANLEWAWKTWLVDKIAAQPRGSDTAQVFFWAGDHGNADAPITISVTPGSIGQFASEISMTPNHEAWLYSAGDEDHEKKWKEPLLKDIDAIGFANDYDLKLEGEPALMVYFSVDTASEGVEDSDVYNEITTLERVAACDVFAESAGSNRQMIDGERTLALEEGVNDDDIDALSLRDVGIVADVENNCLRVPLFYSIKGSSEVLVYDPALAIIYNYFDFAKFDWDGDGVDGPAPKELDALAMVDDGKRKFVPDPANPDQMIKVLYFDPAADEFLFSVGRTEAAMPWSGFEPCEVIRLHAVLGGLAADVFRSCNSIGLLDSTDEDGPDNLDALDTIMRYQNGVRPFPSSCYDPNDDGMVDGADLAMLLAAWGPCESVCGCTADLNFDGYVDGADLGIMLSCWTE